LKEWIQQHDETWNGNEPWTGILSIPRKGDYASLYNWISYQRVSFNASTLDEVRVSKLEAVSTFWRGKK